MTNWLRSTWLPSCFPFFLIGLSHRAGAGLVVVVYKTFLLLFQVLFICFVDSELLSSGGEVEGLIKCERLMEGFLTFRHILLTCLLLLHTTSIVVHDMHCCCC